MSSVNVTVAHHSNGADSADSNNANNNSNHNLNNNDTIRIDTPVRRVSYWQLLVMASYVLAVLTIALLAHVVWWVLALVTVLSGLALAVMYLRHAPLIHLTSPRLYHQHHQQGGQQQLWQLLFDKPEHHELWEGKLVYCRDFGRCIQLHFAITHPMSETRQLMVWQDQIAPHAWRRLKAMARW